MKLTFTIAACLLGLSSPARAESSQSVADVSVPIAAPSTGTRALAGIAVIVPGFLVHGSGAFVMGDKKSAKNLLLAQGVGMGLGMVSAGTIIVTGAAEQTAVPAIGAGVLGLGLFTASWLADIYAVTAPRGGFGGPQDASWIEVSAGYQGVYNPALSGANYATLGGRTRLKSFELAAKGWLSGTAGARIETDATWRFWGREFAKTGADNSHLGVRIGYTNDTTVEDTALNLFELELVSRLDLKHLGPLLEGSFTELSIGYAGGWDTYTVNGNQDYASLLLGRFAFGLYLGQGGEVAFFYDQRHDGFAGGLKLDGPASGFGGNLGLVSVVPVWGPWKLFGEIAVGSAVVGNIGVQHGW